MSRTDKSLKTEGPMILSIDIFYFKTMIIGGPKNKAIYTAGRSTKEKLCRLLLKLYLADSIQLSHCNS